MVSFFVMIFTVLLTPAIISFGSLQVVDFQSSSTYSLKSEPETFIPHNSGSKRTRSHELPRLLKWLKILEAPTVSIQHSVRNILNLPLLHTETSTGDLSRTFIVAG
jgi:hypothetical protein